VVFRPVGWSSGKIRVGSWPESSGVTPSPEDRVRAGTPVQIKDMRICFVEARSYSATSAPLPALM
jgi:hypothetical protein